MAGLSNDDIPGHFASADCDDDHPGGPGLSDPGRRPGATSGEASQARAHRPDTAGRVVRGPLDDHQVDDQQPWRDGRALRRRVKDTEHEQLVNEVVLRSQAQAEYSADNYGHFGLNLRRYAHFTSPIRRYADLVVHRALIRGLGLGEGALPETETPETLSEIAAQISVTERRAMKAERETADRLIAHHLADRIGATFQGRISGVTRAGLFVKLEDTGADGLIPIRTLGSEYFNYEEARHALVGSRSGAMHRLGDVVDVRLVEAAPVAGALRFELLSQGQIAPRGKKRDRSRAERKHQSKASPAKAGPGKSYPGRAPHEKHRKRDKGKAGNFKAGKAKGGK